MSIARHHSEWLSLVEVSGPFLSMPVLMRVFPQGLEAHDAERFRLLRLASQNGLEVSLFGGEKRTSFRLWRQSIVRRHSSEWMSSLANKDCQRTVAAVSLLQHVNKCYVPPSERLFQSLWYAYSYGRSSGRVEMWRGGLG